VLVQHGIAEQVFDLQFTLRSAAPLDQNLCARLLASPQPDHEGL